MTVASSRFAGRRVLITGAAQGIGRATAQRMAAEGAAIAAVDLRLDPAEELARELSAAGTQSVAFAADTSDETSIGAAVAASAEALGGIDTVVCSAGIALFGELHTLPLAEWNRVIDINLTGTFLTLKHALPHLFANENSAVVTVGSVASLVAAGPAASYDASKGAVLQLTRTVAVDYADRGLRANCVCPGGVATDLLTNSTELAGTSRELAKAGTSHVEVPMRRLAEAGEIAGVIAFLCSDDASYLTGAAIPVDGGFTAV